MISFQSFCDKHFEGMWPELILIGSEIFKQAVPDKGRKLPATREDLLLFQEAGREGNYSPYGWPRSARSAMILAGQRSGKNYLIRAMAAYIGQFSVEDTLIEYRGNFIHFDASPTHTPEFIEDLKRIFPKNLVIRDFNQDIKVVFLPSGLAIVLSEGNIPTALLHSFGLKYCLTALIDEITWRQDRCAQVSIEEACNCTPLWPMPSFIAIGSPKNNDQFLMGMVDKWFRRATWEINPTISPALLGDMFAQDPTVAMRDFGCRC